MVMTGILALDQGTTSSRAILFDENGDKIAQAQRPLEQHFPRPGWVEHDARTILRRPARRGVRSHGHGGLRAAADRGDRHRQPARDGRRLGPRATGEPVHNAIVWQDRRTAETCAELEARGARRRWCATAPGCPSTRTSRRRRSPGSWTTSQGARARAEAGELACGTVDSWLIWSLTGGAVHATDVTNASRTLLLDIATGVVGSRAARALPRPRRACFPRWSPPPGCWARPSPTLFGWPIRIGAACGDQQASLAGNGGFTPGDTKATFGTGVFVLTYTGETQAALGAAGGHARGAHRRRAARATRSRARSSWAAPSSSGSSRSCGSPTRPRRSRSSPGPSPTAAASCSCRR